MTLKAVYLTWGETPRSYGIYRSQVAETLRDLADQLPRSQLTLIAGVPMVHSGLLREKLRYRNEIATLRTILGPVGFERAWIPVTQNFVFPTRRNFNVIFSGARLSLLPKLRRLQPDVVHCRSMLAAWIANRLRADHGLSYKILYDARSLWPEMQYRLRPDAEDLRAFKAIEAELVNAVDAVVSVNQPMADHYAKIGAKTSLVNYLAASLPETEGPAPSGEATRLFYAGALHKGGMQDPEMLMRLYQRISSIRSGTEMTIVTTSPHAPLRELASQLMGPDLTNRITLTSARSSAEVMDIAGRHHLACNVYKEPTTDIDRMLCATGFSTKSAEYLAAGLPMLVSRYPEAIGWLVNDNKVGMVFDDKRDDFALTAEALAAILSEDVRERCRNVAKQHFDRRQVVSRFAGFYQDLAGQTPVTG